MDMSVTRFCLAVSILIALVGLLSVRFPAPPGHWRGWIPSHYILLTGLAGLLCFGLHALALSHQP